MAARGKASVQTELTTIRDYIRWGMSRFYEAELYYGHGTDNAWDEALTLVLHAVHLPLDVDPKVLDGTLTSDERDAVIELLGLRVEERMPVPYITNQAWFFGLPFYVDERVLIPRSPIAELIEQQFTPWIDPSDVTRILDIGTGSACIAIACAHAFPEVPVDAVDISPDAIDVAEINVEIHELEEQVTIIESDLFENVDNTYDVIVSNPPYVSSDEYAELPEEYGHEPQLALESGQEGMEHMLEILAQAADYLTPQGILILEVGNTAEIVMEEFPEVPFTWLDFAQGGHGVFLLTREQLIEYQESFLGQAK